MNPEPQTVHAEPQIWQVCRCTAGRSRCCPRPRGPFKTSTFQPYVFNAQHVQVYSWARQVLSLVAGGAIDEWVVGQLRAWRQANRLAMLIQWLEALLWPGGRWFLWARPVSVRCSRP